MNQSAEFGVIPGPVAADDPGLRIQLCCENLEARWAHCSMTAEFLGAFYAANARAQGLNPREAEHSIAYLVNEILENVIKFRAKGGDDVVIECRLGGGTFRMQVGNVVTTETAAAFQQTLRALLARDPGELLIERIEANALDPNASGSGLGILTLLSDYSARLGWQFDPAADQAHTQLRTYAEISIA